MVAVCARLGDVSQPSLDLDFEADDGGLPTFTVSALVGEINGALRRSFADGVWVRGEIQGWRDTSAGHAYFNLVEDSDGTKATLPVSWFTNSRARLRPVLQKHRLRLADGLKVRIHGYLDVYAPSGRLGLKMSGIDPRYTLGELALQRDDVVRRLVAAGLFDANRAKPLAVVPLCIGVVSSVGSAAWHDFTHELELSGIGFDLRVVDVRVQGEWAVPMVTGAIRHLGGVSGIDAIVVIRGGGARSDLAAFDAEEVALAIATSPVPVLTGLGHEIDRSVADDVAYLSLKTPTACAGALVDRVRLFAERSERAWASIARRTQVVVDGADLAMDRAVERVAGATRRHLDTAAARLDGMEGRVRALDPAFTLARGWSITRTSSGSVLRTVADAHAGDLLVTTVADGIVNSRVEDP